VLNCPPPIQTSITNERSSSLSGPGVMVNTMYHYKYSRKHQPTASSNLPRSLLPIYGEKKLFVVVKVSWMFAANYLCSIHYQKGKRQRKEQKRVIYVVFLLHTQTWEYIYITNHPNLLAEFLPISSCTLIIAHYVESITHTRTKRF